MDAKQEVLDILQKIWIKLQTLPEANAIEKGGFLILLLFILTFLALVVFACAQCCCSCGRNRRSNNSVL
ncbi:hypothetical protein PHYPO_G00045340 [Pangasianodon hypophthalmus]|uniref:Small integral membrane protein 5 n=1 Tax=Pangasianodon hypophthalmus TaxID=310915 RepID=A0A5N5MFS9_PANHP|nr:hypothetical protein PHYPO_G00045340 [Pangasianodon hypophthalmus]